MRKLKKPLSPVALWAINRWVKICVVNGKTTIVIKPSNLFYEQITMLLIGKHLGLSETLPNWHRLTVLEKSAFANASLFHFGEPYALSINLKPDKQARLLSKDDSIRKRELKNLKDQIRISLKEIGEAEPMFWFYVEQYKNGRNHPHIHCGFVLRNESVLSAEQRIKMLKSKCSWALPKNGAFAPKGKATWVNVKSQLEDKTGERKHNPAGWGTYSTKDEVSYFRDDPANSNRADLYISNNLVNHTKDVLSGINEYICSRKALCPMDIKIKVLN